MSLSIRETFGYPTDDTSSVAIGQRAAQVCPFLNKTCWKSFRAGDVVHGTCTVKPPNSEEVIVCPDRLYADDFRLLREVLDETFGSGTRLIGPNEVKSTQGEENRVVAFGRRWGKELRVPKNADNKGGYSADWILARIDAKATLQEFVPIEVQTMDTTGSYQIEWCRLFGIEAPESVKKKVKKGKSSNINWENVNKRIIPQLLTKGNVFGREPLCTKGLFFICPAPVYDRLMARLGSKLSSWPMRSGALTFRWYSLEPQNALGEIRPLRLDGQFTTTVENLKEAFNSTLNLPSMGVMGNRIQIELERTVQKKA